MAGNVRDWCWDRYHVLYYSVSPEIDPLGSPSGSDRVFRGGWYGSSLASELRVFARSTAFPHGFSDALGFRTVLHSSLTASQTINSVDKAIGTVGKSFTYQITASGSPTSFSAYGLPSGLDVDTSTGLISGTPTEAGESRVTLSATSADGTGSQTLTLIIHRKLDGMVPIPSGSFKMGDSFTEGDSDERPVHTVNLSGYSINRFEITKAFWDEVYDWALDNGYTFLNPGSAKGLDHPVHSINWYDAVKWCNARSEKEGLIPAYYVSTNKNPTTVYRGREIKIQNATVDWTNGYRLPTEAEWERAARGGLQAKRFPWGDVITHNDANYWSMGDFEFNGSPSVGWHPDFATGDQPFTSPAGTFAANGYGLHDMTGNLLEWCWDGGREFLADYPGWTENDPKGIQQNDSGTVRMIRGGSFNQSPNGCRVAARSKYEPDVTTKYVGFRTVLPTGQPWLLSGPTITSPESASGETLRGFNYQITATDNPFSFYATGLPRGLSCNPVTGIIGGSPEEDGVFRVKLVASNANGSGFKDLNLHIQRRGND